MLLTQEIAEQLKPDEYTELCSTVEETWEQAFGVISVVRKKKVVVEIELADNTRHEVVLS